MVGHPHVAQAVTRANFLGNSHILQARAAFHVAAMCQSSAVTRRHSKKLDRTIMLLDVFCSKSKQEVVATAMVRTVIISMTRFDSNWKRKPSTAICKTSCPVQAVHGHITADNELYELWWSSRNRHSKHRWVTVFFKFFAFGIFPLLSTLNHTLFGLKTHSPRKDDAMPFKFTTNYRLYSSHLLLLAASESHST